MRYATMYGLNLSGLDQFRTLSLSLTWGRHNWHAHESEQLLALFVVLPGDLHQPLVELIDIFNVALFFGLLESSLCFFTTSRSFTGEKKQLMIRSIGYEMKNNILLNSLNHLLQLDGLIQPRQAQKGFLIPALPENFRDKKNYFVNVIENNRSGENTVFESISITSRGPCVLKLS